MKIWLQVCVGMLLVSGVALSISQNHKLIRMLDVTAQRNNKQDNKYKKLKGIVEMADIGGIMLTKPACEFKPGVVMKKRSYALAGKNITVQQFRVSSQSGSSCGFHAAYNLSRFMAGNTWNQDDLNEKLKKMKPEDLNNIYGSTVERLLCLLLGLSELPANIIVADDNDYLMWCIGQNTKWEINMGPYKNRQNILQDFKYEKPLYFVINTGGHWISFKFDKTHDGILVTTADSLNSDRTAYLAIDPICRFLLQK